MILCGPLLLAPTSCVRSARNAVCILDVNLAPFAAVVARVPRHRLPHVQLCRRSLMQHASAWKNTQGPVNGVWPASGALCCLGPRREGSDSEKKLFATRTPFA